MTLDLSSLSLDASMICDRWVPTLVTIVPKESVV